MTDAAPGGGVCSNRATQGAEAQLPWTWTVALGSLATDGSAYLSSGRRHRVGLGLSTCSHAPWGQAGPAPSALHQRREHPSTPLPPRLGLTAAPWGDTQQVSIVTWGEGRVECPSAKRGRRMPAPRLRARDAWREALAAHAIGPCAPRGRQQALPGGPLARGLSGRASCLKEADRRRGGLPVLLPCSRVTGASSSSSVNGHVEAPAHWVAGWAPGDDPSRAHPPAWHPAATQVRAGRHRKCHVPGGLIKITSRHRNAELGTGQG